VVGSPAKTCLNLALVPGWAEQRAGYGLSTPESLASFDPATSSWRTSQGSLFGGLAEFSATWPTSGMTRNGTAYQQRTLARPSYVFVSGWWPTPLSTETGYRRESFPQGGTSLSTAIGGTPNPEWVEWLMGFPIGFTDLALSGIRSFPKSQSGSDDASSSGSG
jgi:hypothetical protein